jgi:DNA-binding protein WhiA
MRRGGSFTERILAELAPHTPPLACCRAALIEGMRLSGDGACVSTRMVAARAALAALHADSVPASVERLGTPRRHRYRVMAPPGGTASANLCCRRARVRGAFLVAGSVTRADGPPQLELLVGSAEAGQTLIQDLAALGVAGLVLERRHRLLVSIRTAAGVATLLSSIGAQSGRLEFEQGRVVRELRAGVNRRLNAETANLHRTVAAAVRQLEAIAALRRDRRRWESLAPGLRAAAGLRQRRPRASLDALAVAAGCSRSAMAGRLRRLVAAANADDGPLATVRHRSR